MAAQQTEKGRGKGKEKIGRERGYVAIHVALLTQFLTKYKNVKPKLHNQFLNSI